jgi:hypothetical protein
MTDSHDRATGITPTRYRPFSNGDSPLDPTLTPSLNITLCIPRNPPSVQVQPSLRQNRKSPKPNPILRVQTLAYARVSLARAFRPALSIPARTASDGRTRSPSGPYIVQHSGTRVLVLPASHRGQGSDRRLPSGRTAGPAPPRLPLSSSPAEADAGVLLSLLGCQWHGPGDSSLVAGGGRRDSTLCDQSIRYGLTARLRAASKAHAALHMGSSIHASPLSGPSRRRRRPRDAVL